MKTISIITACYNEEANVTELYGRVWDVLSSIGEYCYKHIFIDNVSPTLEDSLALPRSGGSLCSMTVPPLPECQ